MSVFFTTVTAPLATFNIALRGGGGRPLRSKIVPDERYFRTHRTPIMTDDGDSWRSLMINVRDRASGARDANRASEAKRSEARQSEAKRSEAKRAKLSERSEASEAKRAKQNEPAKRSERASGASEAPPRLTARARGNYAQTNAWLKTV